MFTGIVECTGIVKTIKQELSNVHYTIECPFTHELRIDQSIAHNGACLTVVAIDGMTYTVTAVEETLRRTNLGSWRTGTEVNLERSMKLGDRLDGHLVQGHVDVTATCVLAEDQGGSWKFGFRHPALPEWSTVPKGSICINGVSLTVVDSEPGYFSVVIIPYTFDHTNFKVLRVADIVNLEFDIIGKYVARHLTQIQASPEK